MNPFSLAGKNIMITGASSGIGRQCAISCSQMGANIVLIGRNEDRLKAVSEQLATGNHLYHVMDVTDYEKIESVIKESVDKIGKISGFIHSAGIEKTLPLNVMKASLYEEVFAVNVIAGFEFAKVIMKKKYAGEAASLVFISSVFGVCGEIALSAYCLSKGAIVNGVKSLALELAPKKTRVNCISPAQIEDTMLTDNMLDFLSEKNQSDKLSLHPLGYGKAIDIAYACIYLLSDASRWVTGTNMIVDGGYCAK